MSEMSWLGCVVNVNCGEIGVFEGKVTEIDDQDGCVKLKSKFQNACISLRSHVAA